MMKEKEIIRKTVLSIRRNIKEKDKEDYDSKILNKLQNTSVFKNSKNVLIYNSTHEEINTKKIIHYCFENSKNVFLPRIEKYGKKSRMNFYKVSDLDNLIKSKFLIYEPRPSKETLFLGENQNTICVTPMLCSDHNGFRIGYGGGYYDSFFSENPDIFKIGLCYSLFVFKEVPRNIFDIKCDIILSD